MRGGITCKACNQTKHSLNEYQRIRGLYRCFSCGSKGEMKSGKDGHLYLITPGEQLPEIKQVDNPNKKKNITTAQFSKTQEEREKVYRQIIHLVELMRIKSIPGWDDIPFKRIRNIRNTSLTHEELVILLNELEKMSQDTTHIVSKTESVEVSNDLDQPSLDFEEEWRYQVPEYIKTVINDWDMLDVEDLKYEVIYLLEKTSVAALQDEIEDFLGVLEDFQIGEENDELDVLGVIEKYKDGRVTEHEALERDESWRTMVPATLKRQMKDWKTADIESVYDFAKGQLAVNRKEMLPFVVELSQVIFANNQQDEDEHDEELDATDSIADTIMSTVEMIILPHLEVLDIIQQKGGHISFSNLWNKPFTEALKQEVKERDDWRCVVCENETDLHVHHKIPRDKGGIHHLHNLVTLCSSCHSAIETADVNKAFKKCLINYKKNKYSHNKTLNLSIDKKLLREEVEGALDSLLLQLNKKEEHELMEEVVGVMKRLEVIFYG